MWVVSMNVSRTVAFLGAEFVKVAKKMKFTVYEQLFMAPDQTDFMIFFEFFNCFMISKLFDLDSKI